MGLSRTVNVIAFDYFYQKIMYKLDSKELLNELVLISDEEGGEYNYYYDSVEFFLIITYEVFDFTF